MKLPLCWKKPLAEEKDADGKLTDAAYNSINIEAAADDATDEEEGI